MSERLADASWLGETKRRALSHPVLKTFGITTFLVVFFLGYFQVLRHPVFPVRVMPWTWLDERIAFQPLSLPIYLSLWLFVLVPPSLIDEKRELWRYASASAGVAAIGLGIFFHWPTRVPRWNYAGPENWAINQLKAIDASGNACPSLHVAFAVFATMAAIQLLRRIGAPRIIAALGWDLVWGPLRIPRWLHGNMWPSMSSRGRCWAQSPPLGFAPAAQPNAKNRSSTQPDSGRHARHPCDRAR